MNWRAFIDRPWRRVVLIIGLALAAIVLSIRLFMMTPAAHSIVETRLEALSVRGQSFEIDGLRGDLFGGIRAERLAVSDRDGEWLVLDDVKLSWGLVSLLFGHLNLNEIDIATLSVQRRPHLEPSTGPSSSSPFDRYRVGALEISNLSLAAGVAGPAQTYRLEGALEAAKWNGQVALDLAPLNGNGDHVQADIAWGGETLLQGAFVLTGVPNGLVAQLLGAPENETITASLDAKGGLFGGDLEASAKLGDDVVLDLEAKAQQDAYRAAGRADLSSFIRLAPIVDRIGGVIDFSAEFDKADRLTAKVSSPSGIVELSGDVQNDGETRSLDNLQLIGTGLDAERLSGVSALALEAFSASGTLSETAGQIAFEGQIRVPSLSYQSYQFDSVSSDGRVDYASGTLSADTRIELTPMQGVPPGLPVEINQTIDASLVGAYAIQQGLAAIDAVSIRTDGFAASASGTLSPNEPLDFEGDYAVQTLPMMEFVGGVWRLTGSNVSTLALTSQGEARPAETAPEVLRNLAPRLTYSLNAARAGETISIQRAELNSDLLTATLSGELAASNLDLSGRVEALLEDYVAGVDGPIQSQFSLAGDPLAPTVGLSLNGSYQGAPVLADLNGQVQSGRFLVSSLAAEWESLVAQGQGAVEFSAPETSSFTVDVIGSLPNVSRLDAQIEYEAQVLASRIALSDAKTYAGDIQDAAVELAGAWPSFEGLATYQAEAEFTGLPQTIIGTHPIAVNADARTLSIAGQAVIGDQALSILSPLEIGFAPGLEASGIISAFGGQVDIAFDNSGTQASTLFLKAISLDQLGDFMERPGLLGTLSGQAELLIGDGGPEGTASLSIANLSRAGLDTARANLDLNAAIQDGVITADFNVKPVEADLSLIGAISTEVTHDGTILSIRQAPDAPLPISIKGAGDVAPLWALAAPLDLRLGGQFELDLSNGDGRSLRFSGPATLSDGVFEDGITGIFLDNLNADLLLDQQLIMVERASATGANGGSINANGSYNFNGDSSLEVTLNRLRALRRADISTTLTGQASVERRNRRMHIAGDVRVDEMRVDLTKLPQAGYTTLDVEFDDAADLMDDASPERDIISLDVGVRADRRIFVDGTGFESEWGLNAQVEGSPGKPSVSGTANLVRGEANVLGQRFNLSEGRLRFRDPLEESELFLQADRTSDGVTTAIALAGEISDPEIELSSDPSLPEDEVLARVLFGRSPSNLSPLQAAQLAGAAAQLAGGGSAFNLSAGLQDATGLDRLDFGFDDEGQATLSTGKYLADDVYLEIESGGTGAPAVALEWTPLQNVEVDAEIDPELGPKVAIQWKRDFDRLPGEPRKE